MVDDAGELLLEAVGLLRDQALVDGGKLVVVHRVDRREEMLLEQLRALDLGLGELLDGSLGSGRVRRAGVADRRHRPHDGEAAGLGFAVDIGVQRIEVAEHRLDVHLAVRVELEGAERRGGGALLPGVGLGELRGLAEADAQHLVLADFGEADLLDARRKLVRAAHLLVGEFDERLDLAGRQRLAALDVGQEEFHDRLAHPRSVVVCAGLEEGVRRGPVGVRAVALLVPGRLQRLSMDVDELVRVLVRDGAESVDVEWHWAPLLVVERLKS